MEIADASSAADIERGVWVFEGGNGGAAPRGAIMRGATGAVPRTCAAQYATRLLFHGIFAVLILPRWAGEVRRSPEGGATRCPGSRAITVGEGRRCAYDLPRPWCC